MGRHLVGVAATLALGGGVLSVGACVSLGGLADEPPSEGGAVPDAVAAEATTPPDAGPADATDGAPAWIPCRVRPPSVNGVFCDDFDDPGERVGDRWNLSPTGPILGTATARTPPVAFQSTVRELTTTYAFAALRTGLALPSRAGFTFRFAVDAESIGAQRGGYLILATLDFETPPCATRGTEKLRAVALGLGGDGRLVLTAAGMGVECLDGGGDDVQIFDTTQTLVAAGTGAARWYALAMDVRSAPCPGLTGSSITVLADGVPIGCAALGIDPTTKTNAFAIELGISAGSPWGATTLDYDDVELTLD